MKPIRHLTALTALLAVSLTLLPTAADAKWFSKSEPSVTPPVKTFKAWAESTYTPANGKGATLNDSFPDKNWWESFHDEALTNYVKAAIANNPDLLIAEQRIMQARATVKTNIAQELPSLTINPSAGRIGLPDSLGNVVGGSSLAIFSIPLQASWELDVWGKNLDKIRSSKRLEEATELQSKSLITSITGEVAGNYVNLLRADALVKSEETNLALLRRIEDIRRSQNQAGLVSFDEVIRDQRDASQSETNLASYRQMRGAYAHALAILTGNPPDTADNMPHAALETLMVPDQITAGNPSTLITRRPDILAQEKILESANLNVAAARKAFLPTFNVSAIAALGATNLKDVFKWSNLIDYENLGASQPIFKGGRLVADLRLNKSKQKEELQQYRKTILSAMKDVEDSLSSLQSGYESFNYSTQRVALTQHSLQLNQNLLQQGLLPKLNVLQSQSELIRYQQLALASKADAAIATISLYKSLGGGF